MFAGISTSISALTGSVLSAPEPVSLLLLGLAMILVSHSLRRSGANVAPIRTEKIVAAHAEGLGKTAVA